MTYINNSAIERAMKERGYDVDSLSVCAIFITFLFQEGVMTEREFWDQVHYMYPEVEADIMELNSRHL